MSRYVDADSLLKHMLDYFAPTDQVDVAMVIPLWQIQEDVDDLINQQPTADVFEIVRCKDCIFHHTHITPMGNVCHICNVLGVFEKDDFFCAWGERKEDKGK